MCQKAVWIFWGAFAPESCPANRLTRVANMEAESQIEPSHRSPATRPHLKAKHEKATPNEKNETNRLRVRAVNLRL
jgi:hypothetical protein